MNTQNERSRLCEVFLAECGVDLEHPEQIPQVMIELAHKVANVIIALLDIPNHKILYLTTCSLASGLREIITRFGITYNKAVHETLVEAVNQRLMHGNDVEFEWSERQYEHFVQWKPEYERATA
ncbi:MAG: hypothetical protein PHF86_04895 [Candidatus Nanoarchaeia archaeon]|nr:hypothetical protein [Candidatus Nanoarchaeia archaeon]